MKSAGVIEKISDAEYVICLEPEKGGAMAKTRQHIICSERPQTRRHQPSGVSVSQEDIQNFLTAYENLGLLENGSAQ